MNIVILQQGGLGDIFFIQKLCKVLAESGNNVYHPVTPHMWFSGVDQIETPVCCGINLDIPSDSVAYDCSAQANGKPKSEVMTSKYDGIGISWSNWVDYFKYKRDYEKEKYLKEKLVRDGEPFILASKNYSFNKVHNGVELTIPKDYDGKVIWIEPNITEKVFDWCWMIENAEQIHLVETSLNYIIETLELKANTLICHPRHYKNTEPCVGKLFSKPWQWVEYERDLWKQMCQQELE